MIVYNTTFMNNATNPVDLIAGVNAGFTGSYEFLIGNLMLLTFFLIFMVLSHRQSYNEVLIIGGFLTTILSILLYIAGMVAAPTIAYPAVLFFIALIFFLFNKKT